jgi:hypothetical protein
MKNANLKVGRVDNPELADRLRKTLEANRHVRSATVQSGDPAFVDVQYDDASLTPEQIVGELRQGGWDAEIGGASAGGAP